MTIRGYKRASIGSFDDGRRLHYNSKNSSKHNLKIRDETDRENNKMNLPFFLNILSFQSSCPGFPRILCLTLTYPYTNSTFMLTWVSEDVVLRTRFG